MIEIWEQRAGAIAAIARMLGDATLTKRAGIAAANEIGSGIRRHFPTLLADQFGTAPTVTRGKAKAASRHQREPAYRISFPRRVPVSRLKSKRAARARRGGRGVELTFREPGGELLAFKGATRAGRDRGSKFRLLAAGDLPKRAVGEPTLSADLSRYPRLDS